MRRAVVVPETIVVQVPFRVVKRGGRKEMVMPVGAATQRIQPDSTLVKALARAFRWKRMLESGEYATIGDLAAHERIAPSYMTRVMRLTLLAPVTVEAIVEGRSAPRLPELFEPLPAVWADQVRDR